MKIKIQTRPGISGKDTDYATISSARAVGLKEISKEIEELVGIPQIRSMSVLDAFVEIAKKHIKEGNTLDVDGLVRLRPSVTVKDGCPEVSRIVCAPTKAFKAEIDEIDFQVEK